MATNTYAMQPSGGFQGGGPGQRTTPGNDAFAGGSLTRAGNPVAVGGAFTSVGAKGGPPPAFGTPATAFARNDRGSNIRIPYARVVSMHAQDQLPVEDPALTGTGRNNAYEYDGLEASELAWIMSKQFSIKPTVAGSIPGVFGGFQAISSPVDLSGFGGNIIGPGDHGPDRTAAAAAGLNLVGGGPAIFGARSADGAIITPSAGMGGHGVNRMERMAYTRWMEAHFKLRVGRQAINLVSASVSQDDISTVRGGARISTTDNYNAVLDSEIEFWSKCWQVKNPDRAAAADLQINSGPASRASLFALPDIAYMLQKTTPGQPLQVPVPMMQGLYVMEKGPFLRSYGVNHDMVHVELDNIGSRSGRGKLIAQVDRHIGSNLAQRALHCELKKAGLLNWTPDGVCLSKDHSGQDGSTDAYFDARLGQLFNIGIQGPCITKTWSNMSSELQTLPMDKVFMLIVGELSYELDDAASDVAKKAAELTKLCAAQNFRAATQRGQSKVPGSNDVRGDIYAGLDTTTAVAWNDSGDPVTVAVTTAELATAKTDRQAAQTLYATAADASAVASFKDQTHTELYNLISNALNAIRDAELGRMVVSAAAASPAAAATNLGDSARYPGVTIGTSVDAVPTDIALLHNAAAAAVKELERVGVPARRIEVEGTSFKNMAAKVRNGTATVKKAELMNFRLMRATSSYLANRSHFKAGDNMSRCGLKIGYCHLGATGPVAACPALSGNAEYILGGWCVGTVVDSAASRAFSHGAVRSAPNSYAININVNVEWWDADKLYSHYQDKERDAANQPAEGTTLTRTISPFRSPEMVMKEFGVGYDEAVNILRKGNGDNEGLYKQPNPHGADTDPIRRARLARDSEYNTRDGLGQPDTRMWEAAALSEAESVAASNAHFAKR